MLCLRSCAVFVLLYVFNRMRRWRCSLTVMGKSQIKSNDNFLSNLQFRNFRSSAWHVSPDFEKKYLKMTKKQITSCFVRIFSHVAIAKVVEHHVRLQGASLKFVMCFNHKSNYDKFNSNYHVILDQSPDVIQSWFKSNLDSDLPITAV